MAGIIPEINPIIVESTNPKIILPADKTNSKSPVKFDATIATIHTNTNPINPPITAKITASNKN